MKSRVENEPECSVPAAQGSGNAAPFKVPSIVKLDIEGEGDNPFLSRGNLVEMIRQLIVILFDEANCERPVDVSQLLPIRCPWYPHFRRVPLPVVPQHDSSRYSAASLDYPFGAIELARFDIHAQRIGTSHIRYRRPHIV